MDIYIYIIYLAWVNRVAKMGSTFKNLTGIDPVKPADEQLSQQQPLDQQTLINSLPAEGVSNPLYRYIYL